MEEVPTKKKAEEKEPCVWSVLVRGVYKKEILSVVEVLQMSGITIDVNTSDVIPDNTDPNSESYLFPPKSTLISAKKRSCAIM